MVPFSVSICADGVAHKRSNALAVVPATHADRLASRTGSRIPVLLGLAWINQALEMTETEMTTPAGTVWLEEFSGNRVPSAVGMN